MINLELEMREKFGSDCLHILPGGLWVVEAEIDGGGYRYAIDGSATYFHDNEFSDDYLRFGFPYDTTLTHGEQSVSQYGVSWLGGIASRKSYIQRSTYRGFYPAGYMDPERVASRALSMYKNLSQLLKIKAPEPVS